MTHPTQPQPSDQPKPGHRPTLTEADPVGWYECRSAKSQSERRFLKWWNGISLQDDSENTGIKNTHWYTDFHGPLTVMPEGWEEVVEAARLVAEWRGVFDENSAAQFERIAEMFRRETGMIAPGKDSPAARNDDLEGRRRAFDDWATRKNDEIDFKLRAALAKLDTPRPEAS